MYLECGYKQIPRCPIFWRGKQLWNLRQRDVIVYELHGSCVKFVGIWSKIPHTSIQLCSMPTWLNNGVYLINQRQPVSMTSLQWRHNVCDSYSNHRHRDCLLNRLIRRRSMKTSNLRVTGLCEVLGTSCRCHLRVTVRAVASRVKPL